MVLTPSVILTAAAVRLLITSMAPEIDDKLREAVGGTPAYFLDRSSRHNAGPHGFQRNVTTSLTYDSFGNPPVVHPPLASLTPVVSSIPTRASCTTELGTTLFTEDFSLKIRLDLAVASIFTRT